MTCWKRITMAIALVSAAAATAAAQEPPPAEPGPPAAPSAPTPSAAAAAMPETPPAPKAVPKLVGRHTTFYTSVGVEESPTWTLGVSFPPGVSIAAGIQLEYNGNGLAPMSEDKLSFRSFLYGAYYFYNKLPFAMGIEGAVATGLAPTAFDVLTLQPGLVVYYAPFPAPVVIGTALDLQINFPKDLDPVVKTLMPGLRIIYAFDLK